MALNSQVSTAGVNAEANALAALLNGGFADIYDGAQPADADTAITSQVKLAHLPLNATAFGAAVAGLLTANAITSAAAIASGTPTWYRLTNSAGVAVIDGTAGTAGTNMILPASTITSGVTVGVSSLTHQVRKATAGF